MQILQKIQDDVLVRVVNQIEQALSVRTLLPTVQSVFEQTTAGTTCPSTYHSVLLEPPFL